MKFSERPLWQKIYFTISLALALYIIAYMGFIRGNMEHLTYSQRHALEILHSFSLVYNAVFLVFLARDENRRKKKREL